MESNIIVNELKSISRLIQASYDKDLLTEIIAQRSREAFDYDKNVQSKFFSLSGKVITALLKVSKGDGESGASFIHNRDIYAIVRSLKTWIKNDEGLKKAYPLAMKAFKDQDVDIEKLFRDNIKSDFNDLDKVTQDYAIQWVAVDLFTDVVQEAQAQGSSVFKSAEKILSEGKNFNFNGYIATRIKNSKNMFFRKKNMDETIENVWKLEDLISEKEELEKVVSKLNKEKDADSIAKTNEKIDDLSKKIQKIEKTIYKENTDKYDEFHKTIKKTLKDRKVSPEQGQNKDHDPLKDKLKKIDVEDVMESIDIFEEVSEKDIKNAFLNYVKTNGSKMAKKIVMLLLELNFEVDEDSDETRLEQLSKELEYSQADVKKGTEDLKKLLVGFAIENKDINLLENLLINAGFSKYHKEILDDMEKRKKEEKDNEKKLLEKLKKKSSLDSKFSDIVSYFEKLITKHVE